MPQDEIAFALWKREQPRGRVLRPDPRDRRSRTLRRRRLGSAHREMPVATRTSRHASAIARAGRRHHGRWPRRRRTRCRTSSSRIRSSTRSARSDRDRGGRGWAIRARVSGVGRWTCRSSSSRTPSSSPITFVDSATGSAWDFAGRAINGPLAGRQLDEIEVLATTGSTGGRTTPILRFSGWGCGEG